MAALAAVAGAEADPAAKLRAGMCVCVWGEREAGGGKLGGMSPSEGPGVYACD